MSDPHEYRCLACMEATVTRDFDVSHLSRTCDACGEFGRFVNTIVLDQYDALEADPPADLHWERLDRPQKLMIAERLTRHGYTIDDFDIEIHDDDDAEEGDGGADDGDGAAHDDESGDGSAHDDESGDDAAHDDESGDDAAHDDESGDDAAHDDESGDEIDDGE